MGNITNKLFDDLANSASWSAGVAFDRTNPLPLDKWSVFETLKDANDYAEKNPRAYPGQLIAYYDSTTQRWYVSVLGETAEGEKSLIETVLTNNDVVTTAEANKILKLDNDGKLPASIIKGVIPIDNLPKGALERCVVVANDTARFALTTKDVQLGDTVKVTATNKMYFVKDDAKLNEEAGYEVYTGVIDAYTTTQADETFVAKSDVVSDRAANKILKLNANGDLPTNITGNAATVDWSGVQNKPTDLAGYNIYDEVCDLITTQGGGGNFTGTIDWSNVNDRPVGTNQAELANATLYTKTEIDEQLTPIEKKLDNFGHSEDGYLLYNGHKIAYSSDIPKVDINGDIDTSQLVNTEQLNQFKQDVEDTYAKKENIYTKDEADSTFLKKTDNVLTEVSWNDINSRPEVLDSLHSNENNRVYFQNTNQIMAYLSDLSSYVSSEAFNKKIKELEEQIAAGGGGSSGGGSAIVTPEGTLVFTPAAAKVENGILEI